MTKTFWLSFSDPDRPKGEQFLGVCLVDVTQADADAARRDLARRHPQAQDGAEWLAAAITKAHRLHCNPGGEVMSFEVPPDVPEAAMYPRNQLLSREDLEAIAPLVNPFDA